MGYIEGTNKMVGVAKQAARLARRLGVKPVPTRWLPAEGRGLRALRDTATMLGIAMKATQMTVR